MTYIDFPNQAESFFEQATLAYEQQQFGKAAHYMEQAFKLSQQNMDWFAILITFLLEAFEEDKALLWFETCLPDIERQTQNTEWDYLFLKTVLAVWDFETFERILTVKYVHYEQNSEDVSALQWLEQDYLTKKHQLELEQAKERQDILTTVGQVDTLSFYQQQALVPRLRLLTDKQFETSAKTLLSSEVFHALFKSYILEQLINTHVSEIDMRWFEKQRKVDVTMLKPVMETICYQRLVSCIEQLDVDEPLKVLLQQNSLVHVSLVYPFQDDVITDVVQWVNDLKAYHEGVKEPSQWLVTLENMMKEMGE